MTQRPYDYSQRRGVVPIAWQDMHGLCRALALAVGAYAPEIILAVARGGVYAGMLIGHLLRVEVYPIRITRRVDDVVVHATPQWIVAPPAAVTGHRVLVVDEISSSGETLTLVRERVTAMGAAAVRTAVLYAHTWGVDTPDYIGLISDALILNPWDREIVQDGQLVFHPEYVAALAEQGLPADATLRVDAPVYTLAKAP